MKCTAINKEKTVSILKWDADGQTIILEYQEKRRAGY